MRPGGFTDSRVLYMGASPRERCAIILPALMARRFEKASLADAVDRLRPGMRVLLPAGCGDPRALVAEVLAQADRLAPLTLMGGLRLDDYPMAAPAHAGKIRFATWHHSPRLRGAGAPDAVLVHAAPPDRAGWLSLGVSVSYALPAARRAPLVIAQVNPRMP